MALYVLSLIGWDPLCPGNPTGAVAVNATQGTIFDAFEGPVTSNVPDSAIYSL